MGRYRPVNPTASPLPPPRPVGRPPLFAKAMTGAERTRKWRYWHKMTDFKAGRERRWLETGPTDLVGFELAVANFDFRYGRSNRKRWDEIAQNVLKSFAELEQDFA